jgi:glutamate N-acetyltransferase / amino-acid N-acetyltransferase
MSAGAELFFRSRWVTEPQGVSLRHPAELAPGFEAAGVPCGVKPSRKADVGLVACSAEAPASAALFTRNAAAAAPVRLSLDRCELGSLRGVAVNSGNANASTGPGGLEGARRMQEAAARELGCAPSRVAVASTGVIGEPLPVGRIEAGIAAAAARLSDRGGVSFTEAIMTTDAGPKHVSLELDGVSVSAQAKGAGMIEPGFATMLCFVQTDAAMDAPEAALRRAVEGSFERITVDGQLSTNDTVVLQASGFSGRGMPDGLLEAVLLQLALEVVADGEGASRTARIEVREAATGEEAERVARAIANSPLVKTALLGRDPNWGRIAQAAGMALAGERLDDLDGGAIDAGELAAESREAEIGISLGRGEATAHVFFCDLTKEYVELNAEYTT